MPQIKTNIIPIQQAFAKVAGAKEINKEAICVFAAIGFFLDMDTYWKNEVVLPAASICKLDDNEFLIKHKPWFEWHYKPRNITFEQALEEFTHLFETIIDEKTSNKSVILPLSGGLDSRTQAVALHNLKKRVSAYSYEFQNGYPETKIAEQIAAACSFTFQKMKIPKGYLWEVLEELAAINKCYTDFCSPRQMAVLQQFKQMKGEFSLGHWGDVLFDKQVDKQLSKEEELEVVVKKIVKKGGIELAENLWQFWQLKGAFKTYLFERVEKLLNEIRIDNSNAKIRAFKSTFWAPRWTSVNLSIFEKNHSISLPYYDNRMCQFICTIPEEYLADRKLQIAYIKQQNPTLAKITWQAQNPYNLNNFNKNKVPYNLPYRIVNKLQRTMMETLGKPYVQRNWELQFLGKKNTAHLERHLLLDEFSKLVQKSFTYELLQKFKTNTPLATVHAMNILLVLQMWNKRNNHD